MDPYEKQKEMQKASSGRMFLIFGGLMLVFTAVTSTLQYGINMFFIAAEASKGTADYVEILESADMTVLTVRILGVAFIITTIMEISVGVICAKFSNRIDKANTTQKLIIALLTEEILMQILLIAMHMPSPGMLISAIVLPAFMLWGVSRFKKIAKADPDRVYAIEKIANTRKKGKPAAGAKSIRERAMMPTVKKSDPNSKPPVTAAPDKEENKTESH